MKKYVLMCPIRNRNRAFLVFNLSKVLILLALCLIMELIFHSTTHILRIFISNCGINNIFSVVLKSIWVVIDFIFYKLVVSYKGQEELYGT